MGLHVSGTYVFQGIRIRNSIRQDAVSVCWEFLIVEGCVTSWIKIPVAPANKILQIRTLSKEWKGPFLSARQDTYIWNGKLYMQEYSLSWKYLWNIWVMMLICSVQLCMQSEYADENSRMKHEIVVLWDYGVEDGGLDWAVSFCSDMKRLSAGSFQVSHDFWCDFAKKDSPGSERSFMMEHILFWHRSSHRGRPSRARYRASLPSVWRKNIH